MKKSIILAVLCTAGFFTLGASAQDTTTLSSRAGENLRALVNKSNLSKQRNWRKQVTTRAVNDTFVYRHEGRATARDEESSPVMIFHSVKGGKVRGGHVYQQRPK